VEGSDLCLLQRETGVILCMYVCIRSFLAKSTPIAVFVSTEELDGYAVSALRRAIAEVKQRWSAIGWVTKLSRAPPCFGRHVKPLVLAVFAVAPTLQSVLGPQGGLWPVLLMCNP
jgi:hypothetical protein